MARKIIMKILKAVENGYLAVVYHEDLDWILGDGEAEKVVPGVDISVNPAAVEAFQDNHEYLTGLIDDIKDILVPGLEEPAFFIGTNDPDDEVDDDVDEDPKEIAHGDAPTHVD